MKPRADIYEKVTGNAMYSGDAVQPNMLYAKILWPKMPRARILKIDTEEAEALPGVKRVITRRDIRGSNLCGTFEPFDRPVLVGEGEEVRFLADALAIVVASDEVTAACGCSLIQVEYQPLKGVYTLDEAMAEEEPCFTFPVQKGDTEKAMREADIVLTAEYNIPYLEHAFIEPEAGWVHVDGQGIINVCFATQNLARHHRAICKSLGLPYNKVRLYSPYIGGAFGGRHAISVQIFLTLIGSVIKQPVRLTFTREESMLSSKRHPIQTKLKLGMNKDGIFTALAAEVISAAGPYMSYSATTIKSAVYGTLGAYRFFNIDVTGILYHTNTIDITAFRGFGWTEGTTAIESMVDKAAKAAGLTPLEIRIKNVIHDGEWNTFFPKARFQLHSPASAVKTLQMALEAAGPKPEPSVPNKKVGRGIMMAKVPFDFGNQIGYRGCGAILTMFSDGSINIQFGFPEVGQGITAVAVCLVHEFFDIPEEMVSIVNCDTHTTPRAGSLGGSRGSVNIGNAVLDGCRKLKALVESHAKEYLGSIAAPELAGKNFVHDGETVCTLMQVLDYVYLQGNNMTVLGYYAGSFPADTRGLTFVSGVLDLEIDEETGEMEILKVVNCHDTGKVIFLDGARGQIIGAALMGIGSATTEEYCMEHGLPVTHSFAEYLIPTALDVPLKNEAVFFENVGSYGPGGAKGIGEHGMHIGAPGVINAVYDATGVELTQIPVTPERFLRAKGDIG